MATSTVAPSLNGTKHVNGTPRPGRPRALPVLGQRIDALLELRALVRRAQAQERALTAEVLSTLQASGLDRFEGRQAVAILDERANLTPDPVLLVEAVGASRAFSTMTVSVTAARKLMGEEDLVAISETTTTPVLRVEAIRPAAA